MVLAARYWSHRAHLPQREDDEAEAEEIDETHGSGAYSTDVDERS